MRQDSHLWVFLSTVNTLTTCNTCKHFICCSNESSHIWNNFTVSYFFVNVFSSFHVSRRLISFFLLEVCHFFLDHVIFYYIFYDENKVFVTNKLPVYETSFVCDKAYELLTGIVVQSCFKKNTKKTLVTWVLISETQGELPPFNVFHGSFVLVQKPCTLKIWTNI